MIRGPLEGVKGILLRKDRCYRLQIAVDLVRQATAVEIDVTDIGSL